MYKIKGFFPSSEEFHMFKVFRHLCTHSYIQVCAILRNNWVLEKDSIPEQPWRGYSEDFRCPIIILLSYYASPVSDKILIWTTDLAIKTCRVFTNGKLWGKSCWVRVFHHLNISCWSLMVSNMKNLCIWKKQSSILHDVTFLFGLEVGERRRIHHQHSPWYYIQHLRWILRLKGVP